MKTFDELFADQLKEFKTIERLVQAYTDSKIKERELRERIDSLYPAIEHGDEKHRQWLKDKIEEHFKGVL